MKKLMFLAAVAAVAVGAQAVTPSVDNTTTPSSYQYSFNLSVNSIPSNMAKMSGDSKVSLVMNGEVLAYATVDEMIGIKSSSTSVVHMGGENVAGHTLISGTQIYNVAGDDGVRVNTGFNLYFNLTDRSEPISVNPKYTIPTDNAIDYYVDGLSFVLEGEALDAQNNVIANVYETVTVGSAINFNGSVFQGAASVNVSNVPEPTSAMLLLLGFAGLALKRKQVA